ncbi:hypothetical protein DPMN_183804 [Dreissena polymorpha]|uniref:Uncharacterized protein n=1 Tax=Dreissena polymorpha TaxID=45954 RepID=A0A9D4DI14_DREPO|nr:hypothetical protein DPMN_183804 [Dreissena polymorpha]
MRQRRKGLAPPRLQTLSQGWNQCYPQHHTTSGCLILEKGPCCYNSGLDSMGKLPSPCGLWRLRKGKMPLISKKFSQYTIQTRDPCR